MLDRLEWCAVLDDVVPEPAVDEERARVVLVRARPLDAAELLEPRVAHPCMHRRERAQLVPDVLGARRAELVAEAPSELVDDLDVVAGSPGGVVRLAHALHAALARGDGALDLAQRRRRREDDVGELRGAREEEVLDDEVVEPLEQPLGALLVRLSLRRVLADDVDGAQLAVLHRLEHPGQMEPGLRRDRRAPRRLELRAEPSSRRSWKPGSRFGMRAHVSPTLDVVLAAQRLQAGAPLADLAGQQREVDQREDVVDGVVVLGDPERPAELRVRRRGRTRARARGSRRPGRR